MTSTFRFPGISKWYDKVSANIINNIERFFYRLGEEIAKKPWHTILICVGFVMLSTLGLLRFHQEKNPIKLWVPPDSGFAHDTEWLINTIKQAQRPQIILAKSQDVLTPEVLREMNIIHKQIANIRTSDNIMWPDVCFKIPMVPVGLAMLVQPKDSESSDDDFDPSVHENPALYCAIIDTLKRGCYESSILEFWNYDDRKLQNITKQDILNKLSLTKISPVTGHPASYEKLLGNVTKNSTGHIISAQTLLSIWIVDVDFSAVDMDKAGNDIGTADWATESALKWEESFLNVVENATKFVKNMELFYTAGRSFSDVSGTTMLHDYPVLAIGICLMVLYVQFTVSKFNYIDARIMLGGLGLLSIGMAFVAACSLCSLFGVFYGPVHTSLPFLLMGLGVDDMFVIIACWNQLPTHQKTLPLHQRIGYMLQHAGVSITVTSVTDFMVFLVGSTTILPSLKSFCIYAAVGVLITFLFVVTFFTACFTLDQKRSEQYRNGIVPCYKHKPYDKNQCSQRQYTKSAFYFVYNKIILTTVGKIAVIIFTVVLTGFGLEGTLQLKQKFDPVWFLPKNTYLFKYIEQRKMFYPSMGFEAGMYMGSLNYTHEYKNIKTMLLKLENETDMLQVTNSWVHHFHKYIKKHFSRDIDQETLSEVDWNLYLSKFLYSPNGAKYQANFFFEEKLECGLPAKRTVASSIDFRFYAFSGPEEYLPAMRKVYEISKNSNISTGDGFVTAWGKIFGNWVTDEVIDKELARNLEFALVCVMVCTMLLIPNVQICFWIFVCVLLTMVNVCGFMQKWNLTIDLVSCIALTLAIGLCVDYAAHIGYTFLTVADGTKHDRVVSTVTNIGSAVMHGGLSTLLALSMLSQSEAYTFQAFFKIFLLVVLFGQFFAIVLLPVILSLVGPKFHKTHQSVQQNEN